MKRAATWMRLATPALLAIVWGCDASPPSVSSSSEQVQVKGTVTVKGKAYVKGKVQFESANIARPDAPTQTFEIKDDGTYSGSTLVGENSVSVLAQPRSRSVLPPNRKAVVLTPGENVVDVNIP